MKVIFEEESLQELYETGKTKDKKYKKYSKDPKFIYRFQRAITAIKSSETIEDIKNHSFLDYEPLKHKLNGWYSAKVWKRERIERLIVRHEIEDGESRIYLAFIEEMDNTHYGNNGK